jgi:hypothetical protein
MHGRRKKRSLATAAHPPKVPHTACPDLRAITCRSPPAALHPTHTVCFEFSLEFALNSVCNQALTHALSLREHVKTVMCTVLQSASRSCVLCAPCASMTLRRVRAVSQPFGLSPCYLINREKAKPLCVLAAPKHSIFSNLVTT